MTNKVTKFGDIAKEKSKGDGIGLPFIINNFLSLDGGEIKGNLDLNGNFIKNLPDPVDGQDAATKNYIDSSQGHSFFRRLPGRGYAAVNSLDMNENRLLNLGMPTDNREAANKLYVDITTSDTKQSLEGHNPFYLNTDKHKARGSIDMLNFKVEGLPYPENDKDAVNKIYVDRLTEDRRRYLEENNPFNLINGEYEAKNKINMKGNKIEGVRFPDLPDDVATVAYVDEANVWERKNGGFVAKDHIYLGRKKLGGLKEPTAVGEATNKGYVDKVTEELKEYIEEKTEEIKASAVVDPDNPGNVDAAALDALKTQLEKNQPFNTRNQKTFNARGNLNMRRKTIKNLPEPQDENEVSTKGYTDEKHEELKDYIDESIKNIDSGFIRRNGGFQAVDAIDMNSNRIKNVGTPQHYEDGVNMEYVDNKLSGIPFTKVNGHFIASNSLDMGLKRIKNLALPIDEQDATNMQFVKEETAKVLPKERIYKFLGTSVILIRGEAKGPIKGTDEILNSNNRRPSPDIPGGFVALDDKGEIIKPTIIYFGKYESSGGFIINNHSRFLLPTSFKINKYGVFFEGDKDEKFYLNIAIETNEDINALHRVPFNTPNIKSKKMHCGTFESDAYYENCNSLYLSFITSHTNVKSFFISLVCVVHITEFNGDWLPIGLDI